MGWVIKMILCITFSHCIISFVSFRFVFGFLFLFFVVVVVVFEKRSFIFLFMSTFDSENDCGNRCGTAR